MKINDLHYYIISFCRLSYHNGKSKLHTVKIHLGWLYYEEALETLRRYVNSAIKYVPGVSHEDRIKSRMYYRVYTDKKTGAGYMYRLD